MPLDQDFHKLLDGVLAEVLCTGKAILYTEKGEKEDIFSYRLGYRIFFCMLEW